MRMRRNILYWVAAVLLLTACNESLEDTYSDFAGDGKIRYVAKCTEVHATPGWERLMVDWINGTDATIDKIKVVWSCEERRDSVMLPGESTSYELTNLEDGTYRFDVCAVDAAGNESLVETTYGRPYTREHEIMLAFTRGVTRSYFLKNKMIFFSDQWNENIIELQLKYKNSAGDTRYYTFDKETSYNTLVTIPDVSMNPADTVYVLRRGKLEDCPDIIEFDPYVISRKKNYSAGFVNAIHRRYGYHTDTKEDEERFEEFVENAQELEFDYDMETFEDILYCPNLKKLVFRKNRYLDERNVTEYAKSNILGDKEKSRQVLDKANEPDILGLKIDYYGRARYFVPYFDSELPYMTYMGYSQLPAMEIIPKEAFKEDEDGKRIQCVPSDPYADADLELLMDNNSESAWITTPLGSIRYYELQMELLVATEIRGIKIAQPYYGQWGGNTGLVNFMPTTISVQTSADGITWKDVTIFENNTLGRSSGEVTLLPMVEGTRLVRYIKISLRDQMDTSGFCKVNLGDIVLYK